EIGSADTVLPLRGSERTPPGETTLVPTGIATVGSQPISQQEGARSATNAPATTTLWRRSSMRGHRARQSGAPRRAHGRTPGRAGASRRSVVNFPTLDEGDHPMTATYTGSC